MKKISTFLLLSFLLTVSLFAQTGPCDLPSSLTMHEVPLYWGEKFGSPQNPLKTDREIRIHKTVKLLLPPYFGHLHLNWIKFEEEEIQITSSDTELSHEYATTGEKNITRSVNVFSKSINKPFPQAKPSDALGRFSKTYPLTILCTTRFFTKVKRTA